MYPILFLKGLIIGFSIAAPVGPIGVLCIRRTITEGRLSGFISGLGAATADALYGCVAGFGLTFIANVLMQQRIWFRLVGGAFLLYLGIKTFRAPPAGQVDTGKVRGLVGVYVSTLFLTLTNPMTILAFMAIFAGLGVSTNGNYLSAGLVVVGVFLGSLCWWIILSAGINLFRPLFQSYGLQWINKISGAIIVGFGVLALLSVSH
jgi:threonine/homoserine/homoserine lactone efflux protein